MKSFIAIKSCWKHLARREACRLTWLKDLDRAEFDYAFIVGSHPPAKPFGPTTNPLYGETDVLSFAIPDDFKHIGPKVYYAAAHAQHYDSLVVMDDDTYVRPERLLTLISARKALAIDLIAYMRWDPWYPQGSLYIAGPAVIDAIARSALMLREGPDDVLVGKVLEAYPEMMTIDSRAINPGPDWKTAFPQKLNSVVSAHKCLPMEMIKTHHEWLASNV